MSNYDDITHRFTYHPPNGEEMIQRFRVIREAAKDLALTIDVLTQDGREKSLALTNLEQAVFWANAAIAREGGA